MSRKKRVVIAALAALGLLVACGAFLFVRPLATRNDVGMVVASRLNADPELASEACGEKVQSFLYPTPKIKDLAYGDWPWARVSLDSWLPALPKEGSMTARVTGVGAGGGDTDWRPLTPMRSARIAFSYRCAWDDNGRSMNFQCSMTSKPVVTRE